MIVLKHLYIMITFCKENMPENMYIKVLFLTIGILLAPIYHTIIPWFEYEVKRRNQSDTFRRFSILND